MWALFMDLFQFSSYTLCWKKQQQKTVMDKTKEPEKDGHSVPTIQ